MGLPARREIQAAQVFPPGFLKKLPLRDAWRLHRRPASRINPKPPPATRAASRCAAPTEARHCITCDRSEPTTQNVDRRQITRTCVLTERPECNTPTVCLATRADEPRLWGMLFMQSLEAEERKKASADETNLPRVNIEVHSRTKVSKTREGHLSNKPGNIFLTGSSDETINIAANFLHGKANRGHIAVQRCDETICQQTALCALTSPHD